MSHQTIVIVDDHLLFSNALHDMLKKNNKYEVLYEVKNGKLLTEKFVHPKNIPDIVLLDINMPIMDGYETAYWLRKHHPQVKILALSMNNDEQSIVRMIKAGAHGYVLKDTGAAELEKTLDTLIEKGFYYSELVTRNLVKSMTGEDKQEHKNISPREMEFLQLACSELTYKEIADKMSLSLRTIDGYRESLFEKLNVKSRTGLAIYAISKKLVALPE